jgi:hypothetical protein
MKVSELEFKDHQVGMGCKVASVRFSNGFGASIITGEVFYTSQNGPYELAVTDDDRITYATSITTDVLGYLSEEDVNETLGKIESLTRAGNV